MASLASEVYEVVLTGGAPWGFRLQGGKEFRAPLRIAKVCGVVCFAKNMLHLSLRFDRVENLNRAGLRTCITFVFSSELN